MKNIKDMTKDERGLLLYLESRAVDYGGRVDQRMMNADDFKIAEKWDSENFISFGRIVFRNINSQGANWVKLSEEALDLAHEERKERAKRMWENRTWISTDDSRELNGDPHFSGLNNQEVK